MSRRIKDDKQSAYYDEETFKVKRLVTKKLQHYFNTQRVENEFDSSGRGIHTTSRLVGRLELAYLTAADKPSQKRSSAEGTSHNANTQGTRRKRGKNAGAKNSSRKESDDGRDDTDKAEGAVSPKVEANSRIKGRFKGEEVERLARNAESVMTKVSVEKIETVHRFRQQAVSYEASQKGKVPHISPNVFAVLNTEAAWQYTEDNEERKLVKEYQEKKIKNVKPKKKDVPQSSSSSRTNSVFLPLVQRFEEETSEDTKRATPEQKDKILQTSEPGEAHVIIPIQADDAQTEGGETEEDVGQRKEKEPSQDDKVDGYEIETRGKTEDSFTADQKKETEHDQDYSEDGASFFLTLEKDDNSNGEDEKDTSANDQLYVSEDDGSNQGTLSKLDGDNHEEKLRKQEPSTKDGSEEDDVISDNDDAKNQDKDNTSLRSSRKDSISNADGISIVTQSSEMHLSEGSIQYNYSDATWEEDDDNIDGRRSRLVGDNDDDNERGYSYSPDPDFSDGEDGRSLVSAGTGKLQGKELDNRSFRSNGRRGSNASSRTEDYTRTESVVSLTEMVRASVIEEEGKS